jgi:hypothetical protein
MHDLTCQTQRSQFGQLRLLCGIPAFIRDDEVWSSVKATYVLDSNSDFSTFLDKLRHVSGSQTLCHMIETFVESSK